MSSRRVYAKKPTGRPPKDEWTRGRFTVRPAHGGGYGVFNGALIETHTTKKAALLRAAYFRNVDTYLSGGKAAPFKTPLLRVVEASPIPAPLPRVLGPLEVGEPPELPAGLCGLDYRYEDGDYTPRFGYLDDPYAGAPLGSPFSDD